MSHDAVVVGGGSAGLAAAVTLARSLRSVVVVDAREPRNAPSAHAHNVLGREGIGPLDLLAAGRREAEGYGAEICFDRVLTATRDDDGLLVLALAGGGSLRARRLVLATGLTDVLPDLPGVRELWGRSVLHCPYCHGHEVRGQRIGVLAGSPMSVHQALLFRQLSPHVTYLQHDQPTLPAEDRARLDALGIPVVEGRAVRLLADGEAIRGVVLDDGREVDVDALTVAPRFVANADLYVQLGGELTDHPLGVFVSTGPMGRTDVPGVWAAGNLADLGAMVATAAGSGVVAGAAVNADLVLEDADAAVARRAEDSRWDERYASAEQVWSGEPNGVLAVEAVTLPAGRVLDVGCGEGADAVWLAARGWEVTACDVSEVALTRARAAAGAAGVDVRWLRAGLADLPSDAAAFDLVSVHYPALRRTPGRDAERALARAVAPGGTLLVVHHADVDVELAKAHGFDPEEYVQHEDVLAVLGGGWRVEVDEVRPRGDVGGSGGHHKNDVVLRARRLADAD